MKTVIKIVLSIVAFIISIPIFAVTREIPFVKLILMAGLIAGITAIWKYNPDKKSESSEVIKIDDKDEHHLDKTE